MAMSDNNIVNMNGHKDDELEELYQQASKIMPPEHLDESIKNAARNNRAGHTPEAYRWFAGIAASVIVGVLFLQLYPDTLMHRPVVSSPEEAKTDKARLEQMAESELAEMEPAPASMSAQAPARRSPATATSIEKDQISDAVAISVTAKKEKSIAGRSLLKSYAKPSSTFSDAETNNHPATPQLLSRSKADSSPEQMLEQIQSYIKQGELDKARDILKQLKQRYPDFAIRPELLEKLDE